MGNRELKIFSGQKGYVGTEKFRRVRSIDDKEISKSAVCRADCLEKRHTNSSLTGYH